MKLNLSYKKSILKLPGESKQILQLKKQLTN